MSMHAWVVSNNGFLFVPAYLYTQNLPSSGLPCALCDNGHAKSGFPGGSDDKESTCNAGDLGSIPALEKGMAIHSSILAWRILLLSPG